MTKANMKGETYDNFEIIDELLALIDEKRNEEKTKTMKSSELAMRQIIKSQKTLNERITHFYTYTYNFNKFATKPNMKGEKPTGAVLSVSLIPNLAVVDIDILKSLNGCERKNAIDSVIETLKSAGINFYVQTPSGGLHIYCNVEDFKLYDNERMIKVAATDKFEVDIFAYNENLDSHGDFRVMKWDSKAKSKDGQVGDYAIVKGNPNVPVFDSLESVLDALGLVDEVKNNLERLHNEKLNNEALDEKVELDIEKSDDTEKTAWVSEMVDLFIAGFEPANFAADFRVHSTASGKLKDRVSILHLCSALKDCERLGINVEPLIEKFETSPLLTDKARLNIAEKFEVMNYEPRHNWRVLLSIMKTHAVDYWQQVMSPALRENKTSAIDTFKSSRSTFSEFLSSRNKGETINEIIEKLKTCVGTINGGVRYVFRDYVKNGSIGYRVISKTDMINRLNETVNIKTTDEEKEEMRENKKRIRDFKKFNMSEIVKTSEYKVQLPQFVKGCEIYTDNPDVLSLYIPPEPTTYNKGKIQAWVEFMESLIEPTYHRAFHELMASVAHRLRHPDSYIEKFFIQYGKGNDGKSYLINCISPIFGQFSNTAATFDQMTKDQFNGWTTENLMIWMEEVQGNRENVDILKLSEKVKQMTTRQTSVRRMYQENQGAENVAIIGLNTNQRDLKGLTRADDATKSRLVIIKYRENNAARNGGVEAFSAKCSEFIDDPTFTFSLYKYLMNDYIMPEDFTTCRYFGKEKDEFMNESNIKHKTTAEAWLSDVLNAQNAEDSEDLDVMVEKLHFTEGKNKHGDKVMKIKQSDVINSFKYWISNNSNYRAPRNIADEIEKLGFTRATVKGTRYFSIAAPDLEALTARLTDDIEELIE